MVVLDELHFPAKESVTDVIGGSGTSGKLVHVPLDSEGSAWVTRYRSAILGARLFQAKSASSTIGWIIRIGYDFPNRARAQLERWNTSLVRQY